MGLHPGALVGSNVRLVRPLSRGGMGSVWRAEHLTLHTEVAVKFVADALIGDAGFLARFTREAVASARIKSPHAVQIFDHGVTADGQPYIVMELLEGEDLRARLLRERKLSLDTTAKVVTQIARGLGRAHAAEIVHRDIKPGNIFLMEQDGDLFVKILDFGIAKRIGDVESVVTLTGQIIGTPHYVSPEQIQRPREADLQNDLWSLAVVAYRCLTGELPFEGETVGAVAIAIDKATFKRVTEREPALPRMLDEWFARAFSRARSARFGSAREMALAFEAAARDEPLPSGVPESGAFALQAVTPAPLARTGPAVDEAPGAADEAVTALAAGTAGAPSTASPSSTSGPAAAPVAIAAEAPKIDTPMALGEPTLSQGTVTHIDLAGPRRTRLWGGAIATIAVGGAIAVGLLSRTDDAPGPATASTAADVRANDSPAPSATAAPAASAASTTDTNAPPEPPASASASASTTASAKALSASAKPGPAAASSPPKKKKDRGF